MMIFLFSCARAIDGAPSARAAVPAIAMRRLSLIWFAMKASCLVFILSVKNLAGRRAPADLNFLADRRGEAAVTIGDLHHQPVGGRETDMNVDHRPEIGNEFHRAGQAVVES